jgi:hypothetical protein
MQGYARRLKRRAFALRKSVSTRRYEAVLF